MTILHTLSDFAGLLKSEGLLAECRLSAPDKKVTGLTFDSREVSEGTLFICKGVHFREEYLVSAVQKGACACVSTQSYGVETDALIVNDMRRAMAVLSRFFYSDPSAGLDVYGITGTKGKTTVSFFLERILNEDRERRSVPECGVSSSVDSWDGKVRRPAVNTTPEAPVLWKYLYNCREAGIRDFVLETSSQALKYLRTEGIHFAAACITNIGEDHIGPGEHSDFEDYLTSKLKIYENCGTACVNTDSPYAGRFLEAAKHCQHVVTFGHSEDAEIRLTQLHKLERGYAFIVTTPREALDFTMTMPGMFNADNALCAIALAYTAGVPLESCRRALAAATVPGRMEPYVSRDGRLTLLIDYAHNGLSFETLYKAVRQEYPGSVYITVCGFNGNKAPERRHDVGLVSGKYADFTVITEKDSGEEPFAHIAAEAGYWIASAGGTYASVQFREDALRFAVNLDFGAKPKVIVFAGGGEATWQLRGTTYVPYPCDRDIAVKIIEEYNSATEIKKPEGDTRCG